MPDEVDHLEPAVADLDDVAVADPAVHGHRQLVGVLGAGDRLGAGRLDDLGERPVVVPVLVGGDHPAQAVVADHRRMCGGVVGGVDEHLLVGGAAAQQVDVVVHLADRELRDGQRRELPDVRGTAGLTLP